MPAFGKLKFLLILCLAPLKCSLAVTSEQNECVCVPYHKCYPGELIFETKHELIDFHNMEDPPCQHYLDVCCTQNNTLSESIAPLSTAKHQKNPSQICGRRNFGGLDFNLTGSYNNEAGFGEFPWTAAILNQGQLIGVASLIHPQVVLTAAHSLRNLNASTSYLIRAGEWDSQTTKERLPYQERTISHIIRHPEFNSRNLKNNFALVILSAPFQLDEHINVVCLPSQADIPPMVHNTTCFSNAWGKDVFGAMERYSVIMKMMPLQFVDFDDCQKRLRLTRLKSNFILDRSFVCATVGIDSCFGDGGAPLVCPIGIAAQQQQQYQQYGITSWHVGCDSDKPRVFANVALARQWIDEQMLANGFNTTIYTAT